MKKEIIIIILILLLITTLNIITQNYTKESVENLKIKLNEISKQIDKDEVNEENIKKITEDIFVMWKKYKGKLEHIEEKYNFMFKNIF